MMNQEWYVIDDVEKLDSPALVVFPERVKKNIQTAIEMVGDVTRLRPHVKTNKSAAKRFKVSPSGNIKRGHAYKSHILTKKTTKQKRNLTNLTPRINMPSQSMRNLIASSEE